MIKDKHQQALLLIILIGLLLSCPAQAVEWSEEEIEAMASRAEATVQKAYEFIWQYRLQFDMADSIVDPKKTGMIGVEHTLLTTTLGNKNAKYLSTQPGWAAWVVRDLAHRGLWPRADVAVTFSGSFPAMNIAVLAALQELESDVHGICSVGASSWGANSIGLSWPEMERMLREEDILNVGCSAVTLGGSGDRGGEWDDYAMNLALTAVKRSRLPFLKARNLRDSIKKRMNFYGDPADYVCYVNVGGNHASLGGGPILRYHRGGWYFEQMGGKGNPNGVMDAFLEDGIPCLNMLMLAELNHKEKIVESRTR